MSLEKLAKVLSVDEVRLMHGPKGVALHVRVDKSWSSATIDNEDLEERRLETIAEHLVHLADGYVGKVRDAISKGYNGTYSGATQAALRAEADTVRRLSWDKMYGGESNQYQVFRTEPEPAQVRADLPPVEPATSEPMASRFHAVMAELRCL
jgi:hypothetical protein